MSLISEGSFGDVGADIGPAPGGIDGIPAGSGGNDFGAESDLMETYGSGNYSPDTGDDPPDSTGANPRKIDVPDPKVPDKTPRQSNPGPIVEPNVPQESNKDPKATMRKEMEASGCGANCPPKKDSAENEPPPVQTAAPQVQTGAPAQASGPAQTSGGFSLAGFSQLQLLILALIAVGLYANS